MLVLTDVGLTVTNLPADECNLTCDSAGIEERTASFASAPGKLGRRRLRSDSQQSSICGWLWREGASQTHLRAVGILDGDNTLVEYGDEALRKVPRLRDGKDTKMSSSVSFRFIDASGETPFA
ncbi:hypothetical protein CPAR01_14946 [Colletotrichum paranaense]|uniref:Uncharacterized protein n=1 Tax=Colletotrichum paranaense TaxID=1914294 RepID=A0ABQ9S0D5_9PEZI|nr:uncharacterized protein CPAR01_14946 [Colletotrichum paranaense]KAK1521423.1 hypothetical protein CPAR01_14946 [Colletotrichum paranaense]